MGHYKIFAALDGEDREGWVWLPRSPELHASHVSIERNAKRVICERREVDTNFRNKYNEGTHRVTLPEKGDFVVISDWYRIKLRNIMTGADVPLNVRNATFRERHITAPLTHPNAVVRTSAYLGLISLALGFVGIILGIISLLVSLARTG